MKNLLITVCLLAVFVEVSGLVWSGKREAPNEAFEHLSRPPDVRIDTPLSNGYFLLLGIAAEPSADPVQIGYEIWLEAESHRGHRFYDLERGNRATLRVPLQPGEVVPEWSAVGPIAAFGRRDATFRVSMERYGVLTTRYERWLTMPFEDWGYGHPGSPRAKEILVAHRLYVAGAFTKNAKLGFERLHQDTLAWRRVLAEAKTPSLKLLAVTIVDENVRLLSHALSQPSDDRHLLAAARLVAHGLTTEESSLRWPVHHEFALGLARRENVLSVDHYVGAHDAQTVHREIASLAGLRPDTLEKVAHPRPRTVFGMAVDSQRTWDAYATFYEATIKASELVHSPMPRWSDISRTTSRSLLESVFTATEFEPSWEPMTQRILEADAHLRLAGLQVALRPYGAHDKIGERISLAGPEFFDPFSGLPMLWSSSQNRLYSVGKDGLDDGGDPTFDLVVPLTFEPNAPVHSKQSSRGRT
ncbi:hypothetical protein YTPLAS18_23090 [Nitrospira sp.]|nr:hypothetical protein YTPLAS18_23090 [Nitrospira sp.]